MSQVLEKPILLDETGQDISSKINGVGGKIDSSGAAIVDVLEDIKDAIGTSGEFIPLMIKVTTPPTKTTYMAGEHLDLTGLVVNLVASNGVQIDVTSACVFVPANGTILTDADTSVGISYYYAETDYTYTTTQNIAVKSLSSIAVTSAPTKTSYYEGEFLDLTGIVVTATYSNGDTLNVTSSCAFSPANGATLTSANTSVSITYAEAGVTKTTSQAIAVKALSSIAITTPPTKIDYTKGDTLDLTGIVVTATFDDSSTSDVTALCTFNPADGDALTLNDSSVAVSCTIGTQTKTATQSITVNPYIYGVEWDGTSTTAWTRTDNAADFTDPDPYYQNMNRTPSSPFDNILPWSGMVASTDADAGEVVSIPKFYYKLSQNGDAIKIQISAEEFSGSSVSPAHMDRGDGVGERDVIYVGKYHSNVSLRNYKSDTYTPDQTTTDQARTRTTGLGSNIYVMDFPTRFTIWLLYLVEFADWNSQEKIGYGCGNGSSLVTQAEYYRITGYYHTGTKETSKTTYGTATMYRNIAGLWDDSWDRLDGCYYNNNGFNIILNPSDFSNIDSFTGGIPVGKTTSFNSTPVKFDVLTPTGLFPLIVPRDGGSSSQGSCDWWGYKTSNYHINVGGNYVTQQGAGMFYMGSDNKSSAAGYRLMKLPANS